jgi:hypothetical protein
MPIGKSGPTALRMARYTSSTKRRRLTGVPPQRSLRALWVGRQKLAHQVAMRAVNLHAGKPRLLDDARRLAKPLDQRTHLGIKEFARRGRKTPSCRPETALPTGPRFPCSAPWAIACRGG